MLDLIIQIPGPVFLLVYAIYSIFIIVLIKFIATKRDYTSNFEIPEPTQISPIEMAYLKDEINGVINFTLYELWKKKAINAEKKATSRNLRTISNKKLNTPLQIEIYNTIKDLNRTEDIFSKRTKTKINRSIIPIKERMQDMNLLVDKKVKTHIRMVFMVGLIFILAVGLTKLHFGILFNKPVGFLLTEIIFLCIFFLFYFIKLYNTHLSSLGKKFLNYSKDRFEWTNKSVHKYEDKINGDFLYGAALFGAASFIDPSFGTLFTPNTNTPVFLDKSSSSSGCGGGGCSSGCGSSCGGGCGGCGD